MGKQTKSRKSGNMGKGKVTPVQIAFIVDRYLADNNYNSTRSTFRNEASDLISRSPVQEAPRSLLSLGAMLDEYISLKEHKVILDQEKSCLEQEKFRVQTLLRGMQDVMNSYNIGTAAAAPLPPAPMGVENSAALVPHIDPTTGSPAGFPVYKTPVVMLAPRPLNTPASSNFSTPNTNLQSTKRRKSSKDVSDAPVTAKRSRSQSSSKLLQAKDPNILAKQSNVLNSSLQNSAVEESPHVNIPSGSLVQGSSVAKCLFNQPSQLPPTNSSDPSTPPQATSSPTDKSVSPQEVTNATCTNDVTPQQMTSTNCTMTTSETIAVSPAKQMAFYSIERNCCISSSSPIKTTMKRLSKRDHVKGRLDFDGSGIAINSDKPIPCEVASENDKEVDCFDFDLPNLDILGEDFSFSELLGEIDLDILGMNSSYLPVMDSSPDSLSGSSHTSEDDISGANQVLSELSSAVTEVLSEKNMNLPGPDSVTAVKSITKSIKILSPVKNQRSPSQDQENFSARN